MGHLSLDPFPTCTHRVTDLHPSTRPSNFRKRVLLQQTLSTIHREQRSWVTSFHTSSQSRSDQGPSRGPSSPTVVRDLLHDPNLEQLVLVKNVYCHCLFNELKNLMVGSCEPVSLCGCTCVLKLKKQFEVFSTFLFLGRNYGCVEKEINLQGSSSDSSVVIRSTGV